MLCDINYCFNSLNYEYKSKLTSKVMFISSKIDIKAAFITQHNLTMRLL